MLSHVELKKLVDQGVIKSSLGFDLKVGGASIDVRLSNKIMIESPAASILELNKPNPKHLNEVEVRDTGFLVRPRQIVLASTLEMFDMPNDLVAEFILRSSIGRIFLNHLSSTFIQPGFKGALTLELINQNEQHAIRLTPYSDIGQIVFHRVSEVPDSVMYSNAGRYNNSTPGPIESK